jgi:hypothetical protein
VKARLAQHIISFAALAVIVSGCRYASSWNRRDEEKRAFAAGRQLRALYVRTPSEKLKIVSAYAQPDQTICIAFVNQGPLAESIEYDWAIAHRDGTIQYNLDQDNFVECCQGADAGANLLPMVESGAQ